MRYLLTINEMNNGVKNVLLFLFYNRNALNGSENHERLRFCSHKNWGSGSEKNIFALLSETNRI